MEPAIRRNLKNCLLVGFVPFILFNAQTGYLSGGAMLTQIETQEPLISDFTVIKDPLSEWIERLSLCESGSNQNAINPDDAGSPSFGYLQFKMGTFESYIKLYDLFGWQGWEDADWQNAIMNAGYQTDLAREMLLREKNSHLHWSNCSNKLGKPDVPILP